MKYTFLVIGMCFYILSCKKNSDTSGGDKTQLLTSADWKYDNGGIGDNNGNIIIDFSTTAVIPACSLDNTIRFNSGGNGTIAENSNVCTGAPATTPFTWNFSSNQTVLNVSGGAVAGLSGSFKIKTLSNTKFTLLKDTTISGFGSVTAIFNLKH